MEARDLIIERLRIGARFDQQYAEAPGGEIRRQGTTAGSGADDDVFVNFIRRFDGTPPLSRHHNVFKNSMSASLSASESPGSPSLGGRKSVPK